MKLALCLLTAIFFLFPPHAREGIWLDWSTSHHPSQELRKRLDRDYFGLAPEYHFIGQSRKTFYEEQTLIETPQGTFLLTTSQTKVNWPVFGVHVAVLWLMSFVYFLSQLITHNSH